MHWASLRERVCVEGKSGHMSHVMLDRMQYIQYEHNMFIVLSWMHCVILIRKWSCTLKIPSNCLISFLNWKSRIFPSSRTARKQKRRWRRWSTPWKWLRIECSLTFLLLHHDHHCHARRHYSILCCWILIFSNDASENSIALTSYRSWMGPQLILGHFLVQDKRNKNP